MTFYSTSDAPRHSRGFRLSQKTDGNIHNTIMASASISEANVALREHPFPRLLALFCCDVWRCLSGCPDGQGALPHPTDVGPEKEERDSGEHSLLSVKTLLVWGGRPVGQFTHGGPASQKLLWQ